MLFVAATTLCAVPGRLLAAGESPPPVSPNPASSVSPSIAATPGEQTPIGLQYSAHDGCPDSSAFFRLVQARTQRIRLAAPGELAEQATIVIERGESGSAGTLELPPLDNRPFSRRVEARTCDEVVLALSLVLALAYDPEAITNFPAVSAAAPASPQAPRAAPPVLPPEAPPAAAAPPERFAAAAGIAAYAVGGIAPGLSSILSPFIEYGSNSERLWSPRVMLSLQFQIPQQDVTTTDGRSATLLFFGGQLTGCPIWVSVVRGIALAPCLGFDLGQIIGSGNEGVESTRTGSLLWAAFEAIGRLRATVTGPVFAEFVGSGGLTLSHGEFILQGPPEAPVHKIPIGFGSFGLGLGVHFR
jgi:hypothetical protein